MASFKMTTEQNSSVTNGLSPPTLFILQTTSINTHADTLRHRVLEMTELSGFIKKMLCKAERACDPEKKEEIMLKKKKKRILNVF